MLLQLESRRMKIMKKAQNIVSKKSTNKFTIDLQGTYNNKPKQMRKVQS